MSCETSARPFDPPLPVAPAATKWGLQCARERSEEPPAVPGRHVGGEGEPGGGGSASFQSLFQPALLGPAGKPSDRRHGLSEEAGLPSLSVSDQRLTFQSFNTLM